MRGRAHTDKVRAEVMAALLAGQGVMEVAERYKLPKQTVSDIKNELMPEQLGQIRTEKRDRIADLVENHLRNSLTSAAGIAEKVNDGDWIISQNAADVAVLYGVLTDKAIRILEAAELDQEEDGSSLETESGAAD